MSTVLIDHRTPPSVPTALLPYDSYTEDPIWQIRFTVMWCAALAFCVLLAAPRALGLVSFRELWGNGVYAPLDGGAHEGEGGKDSEGGKDPGEGRREQPCSR
jgi:hypothetical protein